MTSSQEANSKARVQILSNAAVWKSFDGYFDSRWQRKEIRRQLAYADVDLPLVGEWAILSFHELAKEEAKWKRERGEEFKRALRMSIESCNRTASAYSTYCSLPNFAAGIASVNELFGGLVEQNVIQAEKARQLLDKAENTG